MQFLNIYLINLSKLYFTLHNRLNKLTAWTVYMDDYRK